MDLEELIRIKKRVKEDILPRTIADVWPEIQKFLPNGQPEEFYEIVSYYPKLQGKYLRPTLVLLACEVFGGDRNKAIKTAAAMQTSEDWILMRDDWQDGSLERREHLCAHRKYRDFKANNGADALHVVMWDILNQNDDSVGYEKGRKIRKLFRDTLITTVEGQHRELDWTEKGKLDITPEEWYTVADTKTGAYTIITPLQLGAIVAGADARFESLKELGIPLGRAFQLRDDILNVTAGKSYGKEIGGDIIEGKRTVLLGHLYKNCDATEKKELEELFSKPREHRSFIEARYVISLMHKHGSIEYAQKLAEQNAAIATKALDEKFADVPESKAKSELRDLVTFMAYRDH